ncbi:hypothetical protein Tco_0191564 [Tanacetum coccineum]
MNLIATKQVAIDNSLVPSEKRLKIEKCNARKEFSKPQREETYQVTLDALKLSPCYPAFLITAEVPEELGYSGKCDMLSAIHTDQMYQPWRTFAAIINSASLGRQQDLIDSGNHELKSCGKTYYDFATGKATPKKARKFKKVASPSRKLSPVLEEEPAEKPKKAKKPTKKSTTVPTAGVVIKDTPGVFVLDESQDKTTGTDEGTGTKPGVPDVSKDHSESENESWGDSEDDNSNDDVSDDVSKGDDDDADSDGDGDGDGDNNASDNESTDSDEEENPNLTLKDDEEEETQDDEYVHTSDSYASTDEETNDDYREFDKEKYDKLCKDVKVTSNVAEHAKEGKGDAEMTDAA